VFVLYLIVLYIFFFQAEDGIRDFHVTGVQTCALPISDRSEHFAVFGPPSCPPGSNDRCRRRDARPGRPHCCLTVALWDWPQVWEPGLQPLVLAGGLARAPRRPWARWCRWHPAYPAAPDIFGRFPGPADYG